MWVLTKPELVLFDKSDFTLGGDTTPEKIPDLLISLLTFYNIC